MCHSTVAWKFGIHLKLVRHFDWQPKIRHLNFEFWISDFFPLAPSVMVIIYDKFWRNEFIWMEDYSLLNNKNSFFFSEYFFACHRFLQVQLAWLVIDNSSKFLIRNVNVDTCNLNNWYHYWKIVTRSKLFVVISM